MKTIYLFIAASLLALSGCDDDSSNPPSNDTGTADATTSGSDATTSGSDATTSGSDATTSGSDGSDTTASPLDVTLRFEARVGAEAAACATDYSGLGASAVGAQIADARMFLSAVEARGADGAWVPLTMSDSMWQSQGVALLDFEDGQGACADSGTPELNAVITGTLPQGTYDAVRFDVGVPFALNHTNIDVPSPFNVPGMFWTWQGGYKFLRVDWAITGATPARWNGHIGSTQCVSDAATAPPTEPCGRRNAASIEVASFDLTADTLLIDLGALISAADLSQDTPSSPPGCMSSPNEPADCGPTFDSLGMDFDTGACTDGCQSQRVFSVKP